MPQLAPPDSLISQGLDILGELIERRSTGYGYEVKAGRIDAHSISFTGARGS